MEPTLVLFFFNQRAPLYHNARLAFTKKINSIFYWIGIDWERGKEGGKEGRRQGRKERGTVNGIVEETKRYLFIILSACEKCLTV